MKTRPRKRYPALSFIIVLYAAAHIWAWGPAGRIAAVFITSLACAMAVMLVWLRSVARYKTRRNVKRGL